MSEIINVTPPSEPITIIVTQPSTSISVNVGANNNTGSVIYISATPPINPTVNQLWLQV